MPWSSTSASPAEGTWNALGYFVALDTSENREFLRSYSERFGACSPPVSAAAEGVYEAIHTWARSCRAGGGVEPTAPAQRSAQGEVQRPSALQRRRPPQVAIARRGHPDGCASAGRAARRQPSVLARRLRSLRHWRRERPAGRLTGAPEHDNMSTIRHI